MKSISRKLKGYLLILLNTFIALFFCTSSNLALAAQTTHKPHFYSPADLSSALVYKPLTLTLVPGDAGSYMNAGTCFHSGSNYWIASYQIEVYSYLLKKVTKNITVYSTTNRATAVIPGGILTTGSNRLTLRCNGYVDIQNTISINGIPRPPDLQKPNWPKFTVPYYDGDVRISQGFAATFKSQYGIPSSPNCLTATGQVVKVTSWQVRVFPGTSATASFGQSLAPTTYSVWIPAKKITAGKNYVKLYCNGNGVVQNTLRLIGYADPAIRRSFTNTSTLSITQRNNGWPSLTSYDTVAGLTWHPGTSRTCFNPSNTDPLKRIPQNWYIYQDDYRSVNMGFVFLHSAIFGLGAEANMSSIQTPTTFGGVPYRRSAGFKHRPQACKDHPAGYITLRLVCNNWLQDSMSIPCSKWPEQ